MADIFMAFVELCKGLSKMALINIIAFVVLKILYNLILIKKFFFTINYISKNSKYVQRNIIFIFTALSEAVNRFV